MVFEYKDVFILPLSFVAESDENDDDGDTKDGVKKEGGVKQEAPGGTPSDKKDLASNTIKTEKEQKDAQRMKELKIAESELVRDLKAQLK